MRYESGMITVEIAKRNNVIEKTIYRYKACYDKMKVADKKKMINGSNLLNGLTYLQKDRNWIGNILLERTRKWQNHRNFYHIGKQMLKVSNLFEVL